MSKGGSLFEYQASCDMGSFAEKDRSPFHAGATPTLAARCTIT
jgi:hypothetical protein